MIKDYYDQDLKKYREMKRYGALNTNVNHPLFNKNYYMQLSYSFDFYNSVFYNALNNSKHNYNIIEGVDNMIL